MSSSHDGGRLEFYHSVQLATNYCKLSFSLSSSKCCNLCIIESRSESCEAHFLVYDPLIWPGLLSFVTFYFSSGSNLLWAYSLDWQTLLSSTVELCTVQFTCNQNSSPGSRYIVHLLLELKKLFLTWFDDEALRAQFVFKPSLISTMNGAKLCTGVSRRRQTRFF